VDGLLKKERGSRLKDAEEGIQKGSGQWVERILVGQFLKKKQNLISPWRDKR
jgi:hypothetical protein